MNIGRELLIVDGAPERARALELTFQSHGFRTRATSSGTAALGLLKTPPGPDLVLLGAELSDTTGSSLCRTLRASPSTRGLPIVLVAASDDEDERVAAFEVGADDCLGARFGPRELVLRVHALLRRSPGAQPQGPAATSGGLRLDRDAYRCWVDGREITLTPLEMRVLQRLVDANGRVCSRASLLEAVWSLPASTPTRTVDTLMKRLRQKLGPVGGDVETVRGVGFRFRVDD